MNKIGTKEILTVFLNVVIWSVVIFAWLFTVNCATELNCSRFIDSFFSLI